MVFKVRGEEAWRYDTLCALCKGIIGAAQTVYVVGQHVFHEECLERLLSKPRREFEEILSYMPLDTREKLRKLYEEKQKLPPRGTGLERGTAREEKKRGRGKPLSEVERIMRHRELHHEKEALRKMSEEKVSALEEFKNAFWSIYHCVEEGDEERWRYMRKEGYIDKALEAAEQVDKVFSISPPFTFKELLEALALHADQGDWCAALGNVATIMWKIIGLYEDMIKGKNPTSQGFFREQKPAEEREVEEKVLTREERRKLWDLARKLVDESLREAGVKQPYELRVNGLGPDYAKFLLALRERLLKLVREPKRLELRVETYGKGYGDTHVFIDGEYLYTWRPEFDTIKSSFWGWVRRTYNLLKTLAEIGLLKEEVLKGG